MKLGVVGWSSITAWAALSICALGGYVVARAGEGGVAPRPKTVEEKRAELRALARVEDDMEFMLRYRAMVREEFQVADWVSFGGKVPLDGGVMITLATKSRGPQLTWVNGKVSEFPRGGFCHLLTKDGIADVGGERVAEATSGFVLVGAKNHVFVISQESSIVYSVARSVVERSEGGERK